MADRQNYLLFASRDLEDESFIIGSAIMCQVFESLGDRSR
jgi:hypothetical protein